MKRWIALLLAVVITFSTVPAQAFVVAAEGLDGENGTEPTVAVVETEPEATAAPTEPKETVAPTEPKETVAPTEPKDHAVLRQNDAVHR